MHTNNIYHIIMSKHTNIQNNPHHNQISVDHLTVTVVGIPQNLSTFSMEGVGLAGEPERATLYRYAYSMVTKMCINTRIFYLRHHLWKTCMVTSSVRCISCRLVHFKDINTLKIDHYFYLHKSSCEGLLSSCPIQDALLDLYRLVDY